MRLFKKFLLGVLFVFVAIQFFRVSKNQEINSGPTHVYVLYPTSVTVKQILIKACTDCHSNHTQYPWYANVQPVSWWLANHIQEGKKHLNFSEFGNYKLEDQEQIFDEIIEEVTNGSMPLSSYNWLHPTLTTNEKAAIVTWA
jgi:hypothetical protein